jgi:hypothetical protein
MLEIRHPVELQDNNLAIASSINHSPKMLQCPSRIGITARRDEQRMVLEGIEGWTDLDLPIGNLRLHASPGQKIALLL